MTTGADVRVRRNPPLKRPRGERGVRFLAGKPFCHLVYVFFPAVPRVSAYPSERDLDVAARFTLKRLPQVSVLDRAALLPPATTLPRREPGLKPLTTYCESQ